MVTTRCEICDKNIRRNAKSLCCNVCKNWVHIKCNFISNSKYIELSNPENKSFFCMKCFNRELPFGLENDKSFSQTITLGFENSNIENLNFNIST